MSLFLILLLTGTASYHYGRIEYCISDTLRIRTGVRQEGMHCSYLIF